MTVTVLLVDDHELIRHGLVRALERDPGVEVVAQAGTVAEALEKWRVLRPQVVVTDLELPDGSGLDVVRAVRAEDPNAGILVLTLHTGDAQVLGAMDAGASAFLGKSARAEDIARTVTHVARSPRTFSTPGLAGAVLRRATTAATRLTPRERDILQLVADGRSTQEIARSLFLGESTVKSHLNRIFRKLGVSNRTQALAAAVRLGLLLDALPA